MATSPQRGGSPVGIRMGSDYKWMNGIFASSPQTLLPSFCKETSQYPGGKKKRIAPDLRLRSPALPLEATSISFSAEIPMTHVDETRLLAVPSADTRSPKLVVRLFQGQKCQKPWSARGEEWAIRLIRGPELPIGFRY